MRGSASQASLSSNDRKEEEMKHRSRSLAVVGAVVLAGAIVATSAGAAQPTETWTVVEHDVTLPPEFSQPSRTPPAARIPPTGSESRTRFRSTT